MNNTETFKNLKDEIKDFFSRVINELLEDGGSWRAWMMGEIKWNYLLNGKTYQDEELEKLGCKFQNKSDDSNYVVWECPETIAIYSIGESETMNYFLLGLDDGKNYIISANNETLHDPRVEIINLEKIPNRVKRGILSDLIKALPMYAVFSFPDNINKSLSKLSD